MAFDVQLADRVRLAFKRRRNFVEKKLFGGLGFLLSGNMCCAVWKDLLILRLGADQYEDALAEPHVREFDITGRPMTGWVIVEPDGIADDQQLREWLDRAYHFCRTLAPKE